MHDGHTEQSHVIGYGTYVLIWISLMVFTGVTVAIAGLDLGRWTVLIAMLIASVKTAMVLTIFMHLKYEDRFFRIFVAVALVTLAIFFILTFFDYAFM